MRLPKTVLRRVSFGGCPHDGISRKEVGDPSAPTPTSVRPRTHPLVSFMFSISLFFSSYARLESGERGVPWEPEADLRNEVGVYIFFVSVPRFCEGNGPSLGSLPPAVRGLWFDYL